jgi:hypothetical protein
MAEKKHLPADFDLAEQLKRDLEKAAAGIGNIVRDKIRMSPKGFFMPDGDQTPLQAIEGVIVDSVNSNTHYPAKFDRDNPTPPDCYSAGRDLDRLEPDPSVEEPYHDSCKGCPKNEYESGIGRAKACKNTKILAFMATDSKAEDDPIPILVIPPGAIKYFDTYVTTVLSGGHGLPPNGVVTEISMDPKKDHVAPRFKYVRELEDSEIEYFYSRKPQAETILLQKPVMVSG